MTEENAAATPDAKQPAAEAQEPVPQPPGKYGPAIIVGITLTILTVGAVVLLVFAFTMPRWDPEAEAKPEENGELSDYQRPLRVALARDRQGEEDRPPHVPEDAELIQVRLSHPASLSLRSFRIQFRFVEEEGPLADPEAGEPRIWDVVDRQPGVEAVSLDEEDDEATERDRVTVTLTPYHMPIRAVSTGERIASLWVILPYKRHELDSGVALISDTLTAEITEVEPYLPRIDAEYNRTDFAVE